MEAVLHHSGRDVVIARAWFSRDNDTADIAGSAFDVMPTLDAMPAWEASETWPGEFVTTVDVHRAETEPGRARFWMRLRLPLLTGERVSPTARLLGMVDIANGITPRVSPTAVLFPNLDLTAHVFRTPETGWIGFDTTVSFGPHGHGLTHTVLHDEHGPFGAVQQTLTIRPLGPTTEPASAPSHR